VPAAIWVAVMVPVAILDARIVPAAIFVPVMLADAIRSAFNVPVEILPALMLETVIIEASMVPAVILLAEMLARALLPSVLATQDEPSQREIELSLDVLNQRSPTVNVPTGVVPCR